MTEDLMGKISQFTGDVQDLAKELELSPSDIGRLWYQFLKELSEKNISKMNVKSGSILDWIKNKSNFSTNGDNKDAGAPSSIYSDISVNKDFWNQSLLNAITYFQEEINPTQSWIDPSELDWIKDANAGKSFQWSGAVGMHAWVKPDIDPNDLNNTYNVARGRDLPGNGDKTANALKKFANMQYTHTQPQTLPPADDLGAGKLLRLLMPMNSHHVEIEDLDRNFWVIAMVLQELEKALWENDKLPEIFQKLFDETTQLWENIAYLWMALAAATVNKNDDIHIEVVPLPNNSLQPYRKFDNFDIEELPTQEEVLEKIDYMQYKYSEQNLIVIPIIRKNNYQQNWYSREFYPYLFYRNIQEGKWHCIELKINKGDVQVPLNFIMDNGLETIKVFDFQDKIGAIRENEVDYSYCSPFNKVEQYEQDGKRFYGLVRVVPDIDACFKNGEIYFNKIGFKIFDAAASVLQEKEILRVYRENIDININTIVFNYEWLESNPDTTDVITIHNNAQKYYQGELISYYKYSAKPTFTDADFKIVKIGDFLPEAYAGHHEYFDYITNETGDANNHYDTATYGIGAMKNIVPFDATYVGYHLLFINYCWYDYIKNTEITEEVPRADQFREGYDVTPEFLTKISINRIENLVKIGQLPNKDGVYATKIGISYWTGQDGIQWSSGLVCNLIYYCAADQKAYDMGFVGMLDGYWTNKSEVFTTYPPIGGNRWRRLALKADKITIKDVAGKKTYSMSGGRLVWYDHNKEVYSPYIIEQEWVRPRTEIRLVGEEEISLSFYNPINPLGSNLKMYPYIEKPNGHIFKSDEKYLMVNQQYGVLPWVSGSYDENEMYLNTATNLESYITTLRPTE